MAKKISKFEKLVRQLMRTKGYSRARAAKVAASIGRKKYGKKGMAKKAAAGRRRASKRRK